MISAAEYRKEREKLMERWEKESRQWIKTEKAKCINNTINLNENANFFKDGAINPDIWYENSFRPLFVLKEVNDQGVQKCIQYDFTAMNEEQESNIWNRDGMWSDFGALVKGLLRVMDDNVELPPYEEMKAVSIENYREAISRVAIMNLKKMAGGGKVESEKSRETIEYKYHINRFKKNIEEQISLLEPSIIICCGSGMAEDFDKYGVETYGIPIVQGLHPAINPNLRKVAFYNKTIERVRKTYYKQRGLC